MAEQYAVRAITIPVSQPMDAQWPEFMATLRASWADVTRAANWITTELYARDVRREPDDTNLRPMPTHYLYPELRVLFSAVTPIHLVALIHQVEQTYRRRRYELLWQRSISLPTYAYPVPVPLNQQAVRLEETPGGIFVAHTRLGDRSWALRLRGGWRIDRQREALRAVVAGATLPMAWALLRHETAGQRPEVRLKIVARWPRQPARVGSATMTVSSASSDLLILRVPGKGVVDTIPADHVRRAIAAYEVRRARLQAELAVVRRWVPAERRALAAKLAQIGERHRPAVRTWLQEIAARVSRVAVRSGCAAVEYEDESREFVEPFPWRLLRDVVQQRCERDGLRFTYASGVGTATDEGSARGEGCVEVSA